MPKKVMDKKYVQNINMNEITINYLHFFIHHIRNIIIFPVTAKRLPLTMPLLVCDFFDRIICIDMTNYFEIRVPFLCRIIRRN